MPQPPETPRAFHITHVDNLPRILADGGLMSDVGMIARGGPNVTVGMSRIKERRLKLPVRCHAGDTVGEYVPFYFCPRSVMLYLLYRRNHVELTYRGGQGSIVHLGLRVHEVISWAESAGRRWAVTLSNAGASYAEFRSELSQLDEVNWPAVRTNDFSSREMKEGKQAEFLVRDFVPWHLVRHVGVHSEAVRERAAKAIADAGHTTPVSVQTGWYF